MYLSGGQNEAGKLVSYFDLVSHTWHDAPQLNEARLSHASICLGNSVYVFCGFKTGSIEALKVGEGQRWQMIHRATAKLTRACPALAVLNDHCIVMYGGSHNGWLNDGMVIDTKKMSVK